MVPPHRRRRQPTLTSLVLVMSVILILLIVLAVSLQELMPTPSMDTPLTDPTVIPTTEPAPPVTTVPTPPIVLESTATLAATGDILMHKPVINTGYISEDVYDFSSIFTYFSSYVTAADYTVANLETTLAGSDNGYEYKGYPDFNCPDGIVTSMKNAGFDMLLTANNHSYDTQTIGLRRTQQVITDIGLAHLGTKPTADTPNYLIADINGIRIGMLCYTYEEHKKNEDDPNYKYPYEEKALNRIPLTKSDAPLINSFDYDYLDLFYGEMQENIALMEEAGTDAVVLFIHWGEENFTTQNATQSAMAQELCDLGIDVIIGGHPHVVQPVELLTSTTNSSHKTVCLYSMGNAVSNQRRTEAGIPDSGHTEDGVLFSVTFSKYSDGTVILTDTSLLPLWVDRRYNAQGRREYPILPLDTQIEDWKSQFSLTDATLKEAQASYERTMAIVSDGMTQVNTWLAQRKTQVETELGLQ
ncbi:MAG: CapA family protein [Ruminococcaceae bacterium]|nr:CapA family protein [Oscillospiraceae bacterium]